MRNPQSADVTKFRPPRVSSPLKTSLLKVINSANSLIGMLQRRESDRAWANSDVSATKDCKLIARTTRSRW